MTGTNSSGIERQEQKEYRGQAGAFRSSGTEGETSDWVRAHEALSRLARERARLDAEEGRCLLAALRSAAHVHLGFGSFGEYVERWFGFKPRSTQEKLRVAEALEELPAIAAALEEDSLNWSAARELTRVAVPDTEREWVEVARGKTVHQLEALVAGKSPGDGPSSAGTPGVRRHVLRFEVAPETLCLFREAMNMLRRQNGGPLDDDSALMSMARHVLAGPTDEGRATYQIALSVCPECGQGSQQACGELVPVGAEIIGMADCDGQQLGGIQAPTNVSASGNEDGHVGADTEATTNGVPQRARLAANAGDRSAKTAESAKTVKSTGRRRAHMGVRAKQSVRPATRRAVLARDHRRCTVPGCRNAQFLDVHHIELRSEGGANDPSNLTTLCGRHHRAAHRGELAITGNVSTGIRFQHADGSDYGCAHALEPGAVDTYAKVFSALRTMGFREGETRRALAEIRSHAGNQETSLERLLRDALARLTAPRGNA